MTAKAAQMYLVVFGLLCVLITFVVVSTGSLWGFPLDYVRHEDVPLIQMLVPTFFGILGNAVHYIASPSNVEIDKDHRPLFTLLLIGPTALFLILYATLTVTFYLANQRPGAGTLSLESYRSWLTLLLAFLACTTTVLSGFLFKTAPAKRRLR